MAPNVLVVVGPSGVGKGTILKQIREEFQDALVYSISHTTRQPRQGEEHGREYYFVTTEEFEAMLERNEFVEHNQFNGKYYGTSVAELQRLRAIPNRICLLEIDINGVKQLQANPSLKGAALYACIYPPSLAELERRLRHRGTETESAIQNRLEIAQKEVAAMEQLQKDITICNDQLEEAIDTLRRFINEKFPFVHSIAAS